MASTQIIIVTILTLLAPTFAREFGKEFVVGGDQGWRPNFDYQAWAMGKEFVIGDKLVFKYKKGSHNVFKVNQTAFRQCTNPPAVKALTTGNDVITLASSGWKWYICGVSDHCEVGNQKLAITVLSQQSSLSSSDAQGMAAFIYYGWMATAFVILLIVIV